MNPVQNFLFSSFQESHHRKGRCSIEGPAAKPLRQRRDADQGVAARRLEQAAAEASERRQPELAAGGLRREQQRASDGVRHEERHQQDGHRFAELFHHVTGFLSC